MENQRYTFGNDVKILNISEAKQYLELYLRLLTGDLDFDLDRDLDFLSACFNLLALSFAFRNSNRPSFSQPSLETLTLKQL